MFFGKKKELYVAFMTGQVMKLEQVPDPVFSKKMMGDGYAIEPSDGLVVAPCDGEVTSIFPTKHAFSLKQKNGAEILIHLGVDTVELKGEGFESFVTAGQKIKVGEPLGKMDLTVIKNAGKSITSMFIFTNNEQIELLKEGRLVSAKEPAVFMIKN